MVIMKNIHFNVLVKRSEFFSFLRIFIILVFQNPEGDLPYRNFW